MRDSERHLQVILDHTQALVFAKDTEGRYVDGNPALAEFFGRPLDQIIGRTDHDLLPAPIADALRETDRAIMEADEPRELEETVERHGEQRFYLSTKFPMHDEQGNVTGIGGVATDITERKQMERRLQTLNDELEERVEDRAELIRVLHEVATKANEAESVEDAINVVLSAFCKYDHWAFGHAFVAEPDDPTVLVSTEICRVSGSEDLPDFRAATRGLTLQRGQGVAGRVLETREPEFVERLTNEDLPYRDGGGDAERLAAAVAFPVIDRGELICVLEFFATEPKQSDERLLDVCRSFAAHLAHLIRRRRAEQRVRESERRLRMIMDGIQDYAIFMIDTDGRIADWNIAAERTTGYTADEVLGKPFSFFHTPKSRARGTPDLVMKRVRETGGFEGEGWRVRKGGERFYAHVVVRPLQDEQGRPTGYVKVMCDMTETKQARDELRIAQRSLADITSHEQRRLGQELHDTICQDLVGLSFLAGELKRRLEKVDAAAAKDADHLLQGLKSVTHGARTIARGLLPVELDGHSLSAALRALVEQTESLYKTTCQYEGPMEQVIHSDKAAAHTYRIVQEALSNAVRHAGAENITVQFESEDSQCTVCISDDGAGMGDDFHRRPRAGLGLRIMRYRADLIDGKLTIDSNEKTGTTVTCRFPNLDPKTAPQEEEE